MQYFPSDELIKSIIGTGANTLELPPGSALRVGGQFYEVSNTLGLDMTVSGLGGLDTGTTTASTDYYIYMVEDADVLYLVASLDPYAPTGFPAYRRIGKIETDAASELSVINADLINEVQQSQIETLQLSVSQNTSDITTLQSGSGTAATDILNLQTDVGNLQTDVGNLQTDMGTAQTDITNLQTQQGINTGDISTNTTNNGTNTGNISTSTTDIGNLQTQQGINNTNISNLQGDVILHDGRLDSLETAFDPSLGHTHDGVDAPQVSATELSSTGSTGGQYLSSDGAGGTVWGDLAGQDNKSIEEAADFVVAQTGQTNHVDILLSDTTSAAAEAAAFVNVPSAAIGMSSTLTFDYSMDSLAGVSGNLEIWMYPVKLRQDYPSAGNDFEVYDNSWAYHLAGSIALSSLTANGTTQTATVNIASPNFADFGGFAYDMRGQRMAIVITAPYGSPGVEQLPASANLNIKTVDLISSNPEWFAWGRSGFNKTTYAWENPFGDNAYSAGLIQMGFTITVDDGKLSVANLGLGTASFFPYSINGWMLGPQAVTRTKIADGAITNAKMGNNAIGNAQLQSDSVTQAKCEFQNDVWFDWTNGAQTGQLNVFKLNTSNEFEFSPSVPIILGGDSSAPTVDRQLANKKYVDDQVGGIVSGAATDLSNLTSPTAINQALLPNITEARDLGSSSLKWQFIYAQQLELGSGINANAAIQLKDNFTSNYGLRIQGSSGILYKGAQINGYMRGNTAGQHIAVYTVDGGLTGDIRVRSGDASGGTSGDIEITTGDVPVGQTAGSILLNTGSGGNAGQISLNAPADQSVLSNAPTGGTSLAIATTGYVDSAVSGVSAANLTLSNLTSPTNVNQSLRPQVDGTSDLGENGRAWRHTYVDEYRAAGPLKLNSNSGQIDRVLNFNVPSVFVREYFLGQVFLGSNQTNSVWFTVDGTAFDAIEITYRLKSSTNIEMGTARVLYNGTTVTFNSTSDSNGATGITLGAQMNGTNIELIFTSGASSGDLYPDLKMFQNAP